MDYGPVLARCPLFRGMGAEELPALLDCLGAAPRGVEKGETILAAGDPATHLGVVLAGILAMGLFWQLIGALVYQNHLIVLLGMTAHIVVIVTFEAMFRRYRDDPEARSQRLLFWQLAMWCVSLFPCAAVTRVFWAFWPRPYLHIWDRISPFLLYLPLCLAVTLLLRKKKRAAP